MPIETSTYRLEHDSLGEVQIPLSALWGAQTQRAVDNFRISGLRPWKAFIWSMGAIKFAAASANLELGLLAPELANAIQQAAQEVRQGQWDDQFVVDPFQAGAGTSHNMNANEVIANRATVLLGGKPGEYRVHPNNHVNMSQSTNDVIPTAIRLGCLGRLEELSDTILALHQTLMQKSIEFDDVIKSGRTHLQDAVPIRLGQEFGAYALAVEHDLERIERASDRLHRLGIGGTAVGTGLNAHPDYVRRVIFHLNQVTCLSLEPAENLFESMQSMADLVDFSAALRTLSITLTRIANDFRLLASGPATGLDELRLPALQPGSSIMPGKVNPVMAEMLNMAMFHVQGCDHTVALAAQAGQLELNVMMPIIAHNLFEMMQVMIGAIQAFTQRCVIGLDANPQKASAWLEQNAILVTVLNPLIGYNAGALLVKEALARNIPVRLVAIEKAEQKALIHYDSDIPVTPAEVNAAFADLRKLTEGGIFSG